MLTPLALSILNVTTNGFFVIAAVVIFTLRLYSLSSALFISSIASILYHGCKGFGGSLLCLGGTVSELRIVDHIAANFVIAKTFLYVSTYDVISIRQYQREISRHGHRHTPVSTWIDDHVIVKSRFSDLIEIFYLLLIILVALLAIDTFLEYALVIGTGCLINLVSYLLHSRMKRKNMHYRFSWVFIVASYVGFGIAGLLFFLPDAIGADLHPVWHAAGGISTVLFIAGTTRHLKVYTISDLLRRYS